MKKITVYILLLFSFKALAIDTLHLQRETLDYSLSGKYAGFLEDKNNIYTYENILHDSIQKKFISDTTISLTNHNLNSYYWEKFTIKNDDKNNHWLLELADPHIQKIELYQLINKKLVLVNQPTGFASPFDTKAYYHKNFIFSISFQNDSCATYYVKLQSYFKNSLMAKVRATEFAVGYSVREYFLLGTYYGILAIMILYNLFLYFSVREKTYIFYVFYVIACGFTSFSEDGIGFQFLWPNTPAFNWYCLKFTPLILLSTFTLYSTSFLKLRQFHPWLNKIAYSLTGIYIITFFINYIFFNQSYNIIWLYLLPLAVIYISGIISIINKYSSARYFLFGYSFILLAIIIFFLRIKGIHIVHGFVAVYSFNFCFVLEVVILSYALSERLREEKKEREIAQLTIITQLKENEKLKDRINKELEERVAERTQALAEANEKINAMNKVLSLHNQQLEQDVKKISKERVMQKEVSFEEFKKTYPDENSCFEFLSDLKWKDGYQCKKCKNDKYSITGNFSRRCNKCKYIESVTAFTIFHSIKFSILDAFYMLFLVNSRKDITAEELSQTINLSEKSCSSFKRKIFIAEKTLKGKNKTGGWERFIPYYEED